jgi:hypothetical protein
MSAGDRVMIAPLPTDASLTPGGKRLGIAPESKKPQGDPVGHGITLRS